MTFVYAQALGRAARATCIFAAVATGMAGYAFAMPASQDSATQVKQPPVPDNASASTRLARNFPAKPRWSELKPQQQQALAPLADEWDKLTTGQKKKWLAISARFPSMKPDQQARLQDRMRDWIKLTPAQRRVARESYSHTKKLDPDQKAAEWQRYQQLSEEQKKKLADDAAARKRITNLPPASQAKGKLTPPKKPLRNSGAKQSGVPPRVSGPEHQSPQQPSTR